LQSSRDEEGNLRLAQDAVHAERKNRRTSGRKPAKRAPRKRAAAAAPTVDTEAIAERVATVVSQAVEGQLQITQRAESLAKQELDEERARRRELEEQLERAKQELAAAQLELVEAGKKRRWFGRKEA
jgi:hypothetical protein